MDWKKPVENLVQIAQSRHFAFLWKFWKRDAILVKAGITQPLGEKHSPGLSQRSTILVASSTAGEDFRAI